MPADRGMQSFDAIRMASDHLALEGPFHLGRGGVDVHLEKRRGLGA